MPFRMDWARQEEAAGSRLGRTWGRTETALKACVMYLKFGD